MTFLIQFQNKFQTYNIFILVGFYFKEQHFLRKIDQKRGNMLLYDNGNGKENGNGTISGVSKAGKSGPPVFFF